MGQCSSTIPAFSHEHKVNGDQNMKSLYDWLYIVLRSDSIVVDTACSVGCSAEKLYDILSDICFQKPSGRHPTPQGNFDSSGTHEMNYLIFS